MEPEKLTDKETAFVLEYPKDFNATQAALRAGYSEKTAGKSGWELLQRPRIQAALAEEKAKRVSRLRIDVDRIVRDLVRVKNRCMQAVPVRDREGTPTGEWEFDSRGATKALELLGKHLGMFVEKAETKHTGEIKVIIEEYQPK